MLKSTVFTALFKSAGSSLIMQCAASGLGLLSSSLLARLLGVESFGVYSYALALVALLGVLYSIGLRQVVLREIASYTAIKSWALVHGLHRWATRWILASSILLSVLAALAIFVSNTSAAGDRLLTQWVAVAALPATALLALACAELQGFGKIIIGQVPELVMRPLALVVLLLACMLILGPGQLTAWHAMTAYLASAILAAVAALAMVRRELPAAARKTQPQFEQTLWLRSAMPFVLIGALQQINAQADILMLGWIDGMEAVGTYRPAVLLASLITFGLGAVSMPLRPSVARLFASQDRSGLQTAITAGARLGLLFGIPAAGIFASFGYWLLYLLFGRDFVGGTNALVILCAGKLVSVAMGPVAQVLNMTGNERVTVQGIGIAAGINILLDVLLIPKWGVEGAATASAISLAVWNVLLAFAVYRKLGVCPTSVTCRRSLPKF